MGLTLNHYLVLGAVLFCIGLYGAIAKRNAVAVLMGIEIMLNAVNITLVAFSFYNQVPKYSNSFDRSDLRHLYYHGSCGRSGGGSGNDYCHLPQTQHSGCWRNRYDEVVNTMALYSYSWLILFAPLFSFAVIIFGTRVWDLLSRPHVASGRLAQAHMPWRRWSSTCR